MPQSVMDRLRPWRVVLLTAYDSLAWLGAVAIVTSLRLNLGGVPNFPWLHVVLGAALAAALQIVLGRLLLLNQGRAALGSFEEMMLLGSVVGAVGLVLFVINLLLGHLIPGTVPVAATFMALVAMAWGRASYRALRERRYPHGTVAGGRTPVVIVGAGDAGRQLVNSMLADPTGGWWPAALVDDDVLKRYRRFRGVSVLGTTSQLAEVAERVHATTVVIAIPSVSSEAIRGLNASAVEAGLEVKVLPSLGELLDPSRVAVSDIRDINVTDLLGRHQIDTDLSSIAGYLTDKRVLVTGAGGSIGSELCRQIAQYAPAELIMLDRDESALHAVQLALYGKAMLDSDDVVLANIRDSRNIEAIFEARRPQVVFHAAALKHLPMLEQYPGEAVKTNVWGTLAVLQAAEKSGVERFVNISTDKAANPCSVLGYSKRLAEGLTAAIASGADGTYLSVRFGNVLGSRGSVLTAFTAQIAAGGPVTVTDPHVTRYFMTVQEAVQLVIQAAAIGRDGEALVLDMGRPVSIDAVARQLVGLSGKSMQIVYTGLRKGEKMQEELFGDGEPDLRPVHPLISHTPVPEFKPADALALDPWNNEQEMATVLLEATLEMRDQSIVYGTATA